MAALPQTFSHVSAEPSCGIPLGMRYFGRLAAVRAESLQKHRMGRGSNRCAARRHHTK